MAPSSLLDPLYCPEDHWDVLEEEQLPPVHQDHYEDPEEGEEEWAEVLSSLVAKEAAELFPRARSDPEADDPYAGAARGEAVLWAARAAAWHGFGAPAVVLAVRYLDRCFVPGGAGLRLRPDRPWMARLAAVACLSLAAKVEETRVPLLPDLQAAPEDNAAYVFDAKTVRRMELLVLSALGWRMSPVTPLSFVHHLLPRLIPKEDKANARDVLMSCHALLLSVIDDWRWVSYPPSVWAAAALLHAIGNGNGSFDYYQETLQHLLRLLNSNNTPKEGVEECYKLIEETMAAAAASASASSGGGAGNKRKHFSCCFCSYDYCCPPSPNGVIGSCFSCESSSNEPAAVVWQPSSVSSSPEHPPRKKANCIAPDSIGADGDGEGESGADLHHELLS